MLTPELSKPDSRQSESKLNYSNRTKYLKVSSVNNSLSIKPKKSQNDAESLYEEENFQNQSKLNINL